MIRVYVLLAQEYIPQKELATEIKKMVKEIPRVIIGEDKIDEEYLNFEIFKEDKLLAKEFGDYQSSLIEFSLETELGFDNSPDEVDTVISGKLYKGLAVMTVQGSSFLLNDFFNLFMKKCPEMAIMGESEDDSGNPGIYTIKHLMAGQKLGDKKWFGGNPDELLRRSNKIK